MTTTLRVILAIIIWLIYTLVAYHGCIKPTCCDGAEEVSEVIPATEDEPTTTTAIRYPVDFKWSDATAFTNDGYEKWRQDLLNQFKANPEGRLEITGFYFEEEPKPDGFENMGFARAAQIRDLLAPDIPVDKIDLRARLNEETDGIRDVAFEGAAFSWKKPEEAAEETLEELADRIIIRFPYGSAQKDYDPAVDEYLQKLADRIKTSGEKVSLVGHTDNSGSDETNMALGRSRAREIRTILTQKGVPSSQIIIDSKGESQPTDTNDTAAGRHNNRRVEVRLLK